MLSFALRIARPYWRWVTVVLVAMLVETAMSLASPWPLEIVLDVSIGQWIGHDLRQSIYAHLQRLSMSYYDGRQVGPLISTITDDVNTVQDFVSGSLLDLLVDGLTLAGMLALVVFITYVGRLFRPVQNLARESTAIAQAAVGFERVHALLKTDERLPRSPNARRVEHVEGRVEFAHVSFGYDPSRLVLEDGRLVEQGTHHDLLALGGLYARLAALQAGAEDGAPHRPLTTGHT